jgi:methyl-accepting chemotaxis protein
VETVAAIAEATRRDSRASLQAAEQGTAAGEKSERSMDRVHEASAQMVAAVRMIQEIARQTNMLSLNAAIEAAKAGESGRGFGVVSEEVRKLAERSSAFARQINDLIHTTEAAGDEGRATMLETVQTLRDIHTQVSGLASRMDRIGGATLEQAGATTQVTDAVREIAGKTEQVAAATEQTAATVTEVSRTIADHAALAESLTQLAARFRI